MELGPGTVVGGRYVAERRLGAGGVGEVWAGRALADGSGVAIKKLLAGASVNREQVARFKREAKFLSRIHSQYVARVVDFFSDDEHGLVLVLELVEGEPLSDVLRSQRLGVEQAIDLAWDVLGGVADLHRQQIVHRDLKPGNVILRRGAGARTHAVIVDFGMSRLTGLDRDGEEVTALTSADIAVGTIEYMAPEQILNSRGVTGTADVYAVGAMLYRAVAGEHVFPGLDDLAVLARHKLLNDPRALSTGRSDALARGFEAIVGRMLRRMPAERYARAEDVLAELAVLRGGGVPRALPSRPFASEPALPAASDPAPPMSSGTAHPLELPAPPRAPALGPGARPEAGGWGRRLGVVAGVLLVASAAVAVAMSLHRRGQQEADEASAALPLEEILEPEPSAGLSEALVVPAPPPASSVAVVVAPEVDAPDAALPKLERQKVPAARSQVPAVAKRPVSDAVHPPAEPKPKSSASAPEPAALPLATASAPAETKPVEPAPVLLEESE